MLNINRSSRSKHCAAKRSNLELCSWTNVGTDKAKFEKISISRAILLGFLRFLVRAIRCKANKGNRWREERPSGSCAVKMLSDLLHCCSARCLAQHVAAARARVFERSESAYALKISTCKLGTDLAKLTREGGNLEFSCHSARFLAFTG